jgi:hypothetical protein
MCERWETRKTGQTYLVVVSCFTEAGFSAVSDASRPRNRYDGGRKFEPRDGYKMNDRRRLPFLLAAILAVALLVAPFFARRYAQRQEEQKQNWPWMNTMLSPDERANMVLKEMTLDEKIGLVRGNGMPGWRDPYPTAHLGNGGAGFVLGVPHMACATAETMGGTRRR